MAYETNFGGVVTADQGFGVGGQGIASSRRELDKVVTAIADSAATTLITMTVPNIAQSAVLRVLLRIGITTTSHIYDSTRVVEFFVTVTRVAGALAVVGVSAAVGAQIATSAAGQTLTVAFASATITGGVTATNVFALQLTVTGSVAGTSEAQVFAEILNGAGAQGAGAAAPTGVTIA